MPARQTIIHVRGGRFDLAAQVAAVVRPDDLAEARAAAAKQLASHGRGSQGTTFCPVCGGNKSRPAWRCQKCHRAAMAAYRRGAPHGCRTGGRLAGSRYLTRDQVIATGLPEVVVPWHGSVRAIGAEPGDRRNGRSWRRHVLRDGRWVPAEE